MNNPIFVPNIPDLAEIQHGSFIQFLRQGILEELESLPNPMKFETLESLERPHRHFLEDFDLKVRSKVRKKSSRSSKAQTKPKKNPEKNPKKNLKKSPKKNSNKSRKTSLKKNPKTLVRSLKARKYIFIDLGDTKIEFPTLSFADCLKRELTYGIEVYIRTELTELNYFSNQTSFVNVSRYVNVGWSPLITEEGTFLIDGRERILVSQIVRSPGIYFRYEAPSSTRAERWLATIISKQSVRTSFICEANQHGKPIPIRGRSRRTYEGKKRRIYIQMQPFKRIVGLKKEKKFTREQEAISDNFRLFLSDFFNYFGLALRDASDCSDLPQALQDYQLSGDTKYLIKDRSIIPFEKARNRYYQWEINRVEDKQRILNFPIQAFDFTELPTSPRSLRRILMQMKHQFLGPFIFEKPEKLSYQEKKKLIHAGNYDLFLLEEEKNELKRLHRDVPPKLSVAVLGVPYEEPPMNAMEIYDNFYHPRSGKFQIGENGRYQMNAQLSLRLPLTTTYVTPQDLLKMVDVLEDLRNGERSVDDIDDLRHKIVRSAGDLIKLHFWFSRWRFQRSVRETFVVGPDKSLFLTDPLYYRSNYKSSIQYFKTGQLSQMMDQLNPLSEVTQKRRISVFGPHGLKRGQISNKIRDIQPSQYGRICPIETPEGKNAGLVSVLSIFGRVNRLGFLETPYHWNPDPRFPFPFEGQIPPVFLDAHQESNLSIGFQADEENADSVFETLVEIKDKTTFSKKKVSDVRFSLISPLQIISIATALIPFLEHNDANRVLMGANMQRQAVPLIYPEKPIVGTGLETSAILDSILVVKAYCEGLVRFVSSLQIQIQDASGQTIRYPLTKYRRSNQKTALNQRPIVWKGERVFSGQIIADGSGTVDAELSIGQNLLVAYMPWEGYNYEDAIVINERVLIDDSLTSLHIFKYEADITSFFLPHTEKLTREFKNCILTRDPVFRADHLNRFGIAKIGSYVSQDDIMIGRTVRAVNTESIYDIFLGQLTEKSDPKAAPKFFKKRWNLFQDKGYVAATHNCFNISNIRKADVPADLLAYSYGGLNSHYRSIPVPSRRRFQRVFSSLLEPQTFQELMDVMADSDKESVRAALRERIKQKKKEEEKRRKKEEKEKAKRQREQAKEKRRQEEEKAQTQTEEERVQTQIEEGRVQTQIEEEKAKKQKARKEAKKQRERAEAKRQRERKMRKKLRKTSLVALKRVGSPWVSASKTKLTEETDLKKLPKKKVKEVKDNERTYYRDLSWRLSRGLKGRIVGVQLWIDVDRDGFDVAWKVRFSLAQLRPLEVGDKLAGRHGNKGIVSRILPSIDMPYLPDGTPVDILLNPLGVPSRMNVGQLFESLLGFAGEQLDRRFKVLPFDETYGKEASRILVHQKLKEMALHSKYNFFLDENHPGKMLLRDGRTGEYFDNPVAVGTSYILKLIHMVVDKIHARGIGPYQLVTEQPLAGRAKRGGQRFGEMEVWALESYGCSYTLQELLTVKSDDFEGRQELRTALERGEDTPTPSIPEAFLLLMRELHALGLDFSTHINPASQIQDQEDVVEKAKQKEKERQEEEEKQKEEAKQEEEAKRKLKKKGKVKQKEEAKQKEKEKQEEEAKQKAKAKQEEEKKQKEAKQKTGKGKKTKKKSKAKVLVTRKKGDSSDLFEQLEERLKLKTLLEAEHGKYFSKREKLKKEIKDRRQVLEARLEASSSQEELLEIIPPDTSSKPTKKRKGTSRIKSTPPVDNSYDQSISSKKKRTSGKKK